MAPLSGVTTAVSALAWIIFYLPAYVYFPLVTGVVVVFTAMSIIV